MRGRDLGSTVAEAQQRIANNVTLPSGYRIEFAGEFEELQLAKERQYRGGHLNLCIRPSRLHSRC